MKVGYVRAVGVNDGSPTRHCVGYSGGVRPPRERLQQLSGWEHPNSSPVCSNPTGGPSPIDAYMPPYFTSSVMFVQYHRTNHKH